MKNNLFVFLLFCSLAIENAMAKSQEKTSDTQIKILWEYKDLPHGMKIYDLKGKPRLWKTESVNDEKLLPVEKEIPDSAFSLQPGRAKKFALVYKNTTDKPLHFFAAPHSAEPPENSLGFKFKCLCINHAYQVNPGETWYRIVEFRLSQVFSDPQLAVKHVLIGISSEKAQSINAAPPVDVNNHDM